MSLIGERKDRIGSCPQKNGVIALFIRTEFPGYHRVIIFNNEMQRNIHSYFSI